MKISTRFFAAFCLSLSLTACNQPAYLNHTQQPPQTLQPAQAAEATESIQLNLAQWAGQGLRTQFASFAQIAFVRLRVVGEGLSDPITSDLLAFDSNHLSASLKGIPKSKGKLRVVSAQAYDSEQNLLPSFEAKAYYLSSSDSRLEISAERRYYLLSAILENLLSYDLERLALLDRTALQSTLETMMGYKSASQTFTTDPSMYNLQALVEQIAADGSFPEAASLSAAALESSSNASITLSTPEELPLGQELRLLVNDPRSLPVRIPRLSASGSSQSVTGIAPGNWTLEIQNTAGETLASTSVSVDGAGGVSLGSNNLELTDITQARGEFRVNTTTDMNQSDPGIAMDGSGNFTVVWTSPHESNRDIYGQRYLASGKPDGGEFRVNTYTTNAQEHAFITMNTGGQSVITWESEGQDGSGKGIYAQRYNAAGQAQGDEFRVNTTTVSEQKNPVVAMDSSGNFVVAWTHLVGANLDIFAQRYNAAGQAQGEEFRVNFTQDGTQDDPAIALDAQGNFVVVWQSEEQDGSNEGIYAQRYDASGTPQGDEFLVNTTTDNSQTSPAVAMDSQGNFVVSWSSQNQDGDDKGIYAQRYNAAGQAQGDEFRVNTYTSSYQDGSKIAMQANGNFVISWLSSGQDGSNNGIYAQRYAANGNTIAKEFRVNTYTTGHQTNPVLALNSQGQLVVSWESEQNQDGNGSGVYAQLLNPWGEFL